MSTKLSNLGGSFFVLKLMSNVSKILLIKERRRDFGIFVAFLTVLTAFTNFSWKAVIRLAVIKLLLHVSFHHLFCCLFVDPNCQSKNTLVQCHQR